ncbi:hypothetical protein BESB_041080 [Besnoitia besnoiti]|uniref:Uncharacterized protein n=1 Tax=Besnoitia besnoiti TaxID=94643 RepID=A0A2A9MPB6_BESBE|nr:hypothetical protein BESB_041080 [Besnoitia besnoiti]PFH37650.1 hypothetical protein BESB_041080 [Besnoitia besnoiti]
MPSAIRAGLGGVVVWVAHSDWKPLSSSGPFGAHLTENGNGFASASSGECIRARPCSIQRWDTARDHARNCAPSALRPAGGVRRPLADSLANFFVCSVELLRTEPYGSKQQHQPPARSRRAGRHVSQLSPRRRHREGTSAGGLEDSWTSRCEERTRGGGGGEPGGQLQRATCHRGAANAGPRWRTRLLALPARLFAGRTLLECMQVRSPSPRAPGLRNSARRLSDDSQPTVPPQCRVPCGAPDERLSQGSADDSDQGAGAGSETPVSGSGQACAEGAPALGSRLEAGAEAHRGEGAVLQQLPSRSSDGGCGGAPPDSQGALQAAVNISSFDGFSKGTWKSSCVARAHSAGAP